MEELTISCFARKLITNFIRKLALKVIRDYPTTFYEASEYLFHTTAADKLIKWGNLVLKYVWLINCELLMYPLVGKYEWKQL